MKKKLNQQNLRIAQRNKSDNSILFDLLFTLASLVLIVVIFMTLVSLNGCTSLSYYDAPEKHKIVPHVSGSIILNNGDKIIIVNSVVTMSPDVVRVESTMVRSTILVQNIHSITLYNCDYKPLPSNEKALNESIVKNK